MLSARTICSAILWLALWGMCAAEPPTIVSKADWNAVPVAVENMTKLSLPVRRVVISHSAGVDCTNTDACIQQLLNLQNYHMNVLNYEDIAYNFLIGNDGHVYEGRGWDLQGAFARGFNSGSLGISFIGNYERSLPNSEALEAAKALVAYAVDTGKLREDYKLFGHRQLAATTSPGNALYAALQEWPHWSRNTRN